MGFMPLIGAIGLIGLMGEIFLIPLGFFRKCHAIPRN
jgi:hypothetical protein